RAQTEDAHACLARLQPRGFQGLPVDHEPSANHERAEAGGDDRACASNPEPWAALEARDLAIRDDIAEVRGDLHPERDGQPDRVEVAELVEHAAEAGRPRDSDRRTEREGSPDPDEDRVLCGMAFEMRHRPQ